MKLLLGCVIGGAAPLAEYAVTGSLGGAWVTAGFALGAWFAGLLAGGRYERRP